MSNEQLVIALSRAKAVGKGRFSTIGDISCDIRVRTVVTASKRMLIFCNPFQGGLEFLTHSSTLSEPFYKIPQSIIPNSLPTIHMMAVDILPSSLPLDASRHFSQALFPYLISLIREYQGESITDAYRNALNKATVTTAGVLVDKHAWLKEPLETWRDATNGMTEILPATISSSGLKDNGVQPSKVLILGSGMVAGPAVDEICKRESIRLIVGSFHPFYNPGEGLIFHRSKQFET